MKLYYSAYTRAVRVRWLLEELGLPYELDTRPLPAFREEAYLGVHPLGKVPALEDGGVTLIESGAIVQYLLECYGEGRLEPAIGSPERAAYLQWFHYGEATLLPPLSDITQHTLLRAEADRIPEVAEDGVRRAAQALAPIEDALEDRDWLCGEFTAADIMVGYAVLLAQFLGQLGESLPRARGHLARCEARPAYQKAIT